GRDDRRRLRVGRNCSHQRPPLVYETTVSITRTEVNIARPADPDRRARTLDRAADYVLDHGLEGLSLRPLAKALGTSPRMLLYDFASKEQLVDEVLAEVRRREVRLIEEQGIDFGGTAGDALHAVWRWVSAEERAPF